MGYVFNFMLGMCREGCRKVIASRERRRRRGQWAGGVAAIDLSVWSAAKLPADYLTYVAREKQAEQKGVCFVRRRVKRLRDFLRFSRAENCGVGRSAREQGRD